MHGCTCNEHTYRVGTAEPEIDAAVVAMQAGDYTDPFAEADENEAAARQAAKQHMARPLAQGPQQLQQQTAASQTAPAGLPSPAPAPAASGGMAGLAAPGSSSGLQPAGGHGPWHAFPAGSHAAPQASRPRHLQ